MADLLQFSLEIGFDSRSIASSDNPLLSSPRAILPLVNGSTSETLLLTTVAAESGFEGVAPVKLLLLEFFEDLLLFAFPALFEDFSGVCLCSAASAFEMPSCFFHFVRLFWNQIFTCVSVTFKSLAISVLSLEERYFLISNCFSNSKICRPVKVVLAFFLLPLSPLSWSLPQLGGLLSPRVELRLLEQLLLPFRLPGGLTLLKAPGSPSVTCPTTGLLLLFPSSGGLC
ncbi:hypothetical protein X975_10821, partial [Stegodyphus mimosarum]